MLAIGCCSKIKIPCCNWDYVNNILKNKKSKEIIACLLNKLNTVKVLYYLEEIISFLNKSVDKKENSNQKFQEEVSDFYLILEILGFKFSLPSYNLEIKALIKKWQELRKDGEYSQADKIRSELQKKGII